MSIGQWIVLAAAAVTVFWMVGAHNRLVAMRSAIGRAFGQVDELMERRLASAKALVEAARQALAGEPDAIDAWLAALAASSQAAAALRLHPADADPAAALAASEAALAARATRVMALLEQRQDQLDDVAAAQQALLQDLQSRLAFARQLFNDATQAYNAAAQELPTRWLTRLYRFGPAGRL
ncbi:MAG TPA: LemA family protein [Rubrivivax sp.]|nr:LemA family protein [Burkholderiales bacterium]HNU12470.1 LemA family protein [Rubrivivax sp.]